MRKIAKIVGVVILAVVLIFVWRIFIRFLSIIPHEKITISLPFEKVDDTFEITTGY